MEFPGTRERAGIRGQELESRAEELLPAGLEGVKYVRDLEAKHFKAETAVGSVFLEVRSVRELLELAAGQRGDLDGDDRERLRKLGMPEAAFAAEARYLLVNTAGEVGVLAATEAPLEAMVSVERHKGGEGDSLSLVYEQEFSKVPVSYATVIIGRREGDPSREEIWTAHPGLPMADFRPGVVELGEKISVGELLNRFSKAFPDLDQRAIPLQLRGAKR
jgi:hypothetical protein